MVKKFTAIYCESWLVGSHWQKKVHFVRLTLQEGETILEACEREGIANQLEFIFVGHPENEGE